MAAAAATASCKVVWVRGNAEMLTSGLNVDDDDEDLSVIVVVSLQQRRKRAASSRPLELCQRRRSSRLHTLDPGDSRLHTLE